MYRYLLDTNTLSEIITNRPNLNVVKKFKTHYYESVTTSITLFEMLKGAHSCKNLVKKSNILMFIEEVVLALPILSYTDQVAHWHGQEHGRLVSEGKTPPELDGQIAAIAKVNDLILVTRNTKDVINFQNLKLENWFVENENTFN
jgi:tRNA(fMet)-specific endonuclease VapC